MTDWKQANRLLSEGYETRVPDYDLKPVLELLSGIDPQTIADTMAEAIIMLADQILLGHRISNQRSQMIMETCKMFYRAFSNVSFDKERFLDSVGAQIMNREGLFASEPDILYPTS